MGEAANHTDAEDARLTAGLRTATPEARARLRTALRAVRRTRQPLAEWRGGQQGADGAIHFPFPVYHPAVDRLVSALYQVHAVVPFDWMHWDGARRYPRAEDVSNAPVADAVRLVTAIVRGERFCDGTIAAALEDGRLPAAAQRVLDDARAGDDSTRAGEQSPALPQGSTRHFIAVPPEPTSGGGPGHRGSALRRAAGGPRQTSAREGRRARLSTETAGSQDEPPRVQRAAHTPRRGVPGRRPGDRDVWLVPDSPSC
ncbi:DUF6508 domain-containing protein [Geodermatophilus sp. SYSU D00867]